MPERPEDDPRVYLAAERTLLAWLRTGLALMGFGFVVARFGLFLRELETAHSGVTRLSPHGSLWFGTALVLIGVIVNVRAAIEHRRYVKLLRSGTWTPDHGLHAGTVLAAALAVSGVAIVVYLLVVR